MYCNVLENEFPATIAWLLVHYAHFFDVVVKRLAIKGTGGPSFVGAI